MSFSERTGNRRPAPPRVQYEAAPAPLRALMLELMQGRWGNRGSYNVLCSGLGIVPKPGIVGDATAYRPLVELVEQLEWFEVFDLLEQVGPPGRHDQAINDRLAMCGLAYEMTDGKIDLFDPEGEAIGVTGIEHEAVALLDGRFESVRDQYAKALTALHGRPADLEKAVSESLNALEAVARILSGKKDFGPAIDSALSGRRDAGGLAAALKALYGWSSQVPGVRHGRIGEPDLTFADAKYAVRTVGITIAYLIEHNS